MNEKVAIAANIGRALYPEAPPTNNTCEQALRPSAIHQKVTNGFRSERAAKACAALKTMIDTAKLKA